MAAMRLNWVDPEWQETYADQIETPEKAVGRIRPGDRVFIGTGCGQPLRLVRALVGRSADLADVEIVHLLTFGDAPYATKEMSATFRINSFFIGENVRDLIQQGIGAYTPIFLSDIPRLFSSGRLPLDAALIHVTPPDANGYCSLGISVDIVKSAAQNASLVIAQVNPRMPRTLGNAMIHVHDIDVLVPVEEELVEYENPPQNEATDRIGSFVASLVDDGSTVEFGIGKIPQAVVSHLKDKRDLGIHTEMVSDSVIDLIESGVVTGRRKSVDRGKVVTTFCVGSRRLYDFVDNNDTFAFHPTDYVNDPFVIGRQNRPVAINTALEVDLTGQVGADSLAGAFYSGIGGQVDFNRGAAHAPDGKAIIALPSTARGGEISRIVTRLSDGAGVVTTRGDVHYVVTEYGVAYLHGKSVEERAIALIAIAHPDYRARLLKEAVDARYLHPEFARVEGKLVVGPTELRTTRLLGDGTQVTFRPIHPTDEPRITDLFYALSQETIYYRYMSRSKTVPRSEIQNFVFIDHRSELAIVCTVPEAHGEDIIAVGRYYLDEKTNMAEVAFVVRDDWQNKGIGTELLRYLAQIAIRNGIRGFTAEVLRANRAMQRVFHKLDHQVTSEPQDDVYSFVIEFQ
ncbi:MAG: GNAT family N-acetyltransferase [Trueperaceae bacterium]|nr:GNAT family N-acetyltransferase [Trueperaceae bacterium]